MATAIVTFRRRRSTPRAFVMTLSRKIILRNLVLLLGVLLLGVASLVGLWMLRGQVDVALDEYAELRLLARAENEAQSARAAILAARPDLDAVRRDLHNAIVAMEEYVALQAEAREGSEEHESNERESATAALTSLRGVLGRAEERLSRGPALDAEDRSLLAGQLRETITRVRGLTKEADMLVASTGRRAGRRLRNTTAVLAGVFLLIVASTVVVGVLQHRGVIVPLRSVTRAVREVAAGRFDLRLPPAGDREFAELVVEFNRMAVELDDLYRSLEAKVVEKSRELVRSERLASVGFLAAGVAHEINNPLHIISGYAELSLKRLRGFGATDGGRRDDGDGAARAVVSDAAGTLQIIRDEAFRCKGITAKLLSLSKPGGTVHQPVSVADAAREVVSIVRAHEAFKDRSLDCRLDDGDALLTRGNEAEIKQVLLNLVINALEAVEPGRGHVVIEGARDDGSVELRVIDNGCGMTPEVIDHAFEPFFTGKRERGGGGGGGVGLGLSISYAIVEGHGGVIRAESGGVGAGSRFTLRLPAFAQEGAAVA
jgi:two-component system, NtrC family, sensor kinase